MRKLSVLNYLVLLMAMPGLSQTHEAFEIVISEVMFDPLPAVGMGGYEYIELFNQGEDTVNLADWIWQVGSKSVLLTDFSLNPGACVLLLPPGIKPVESINYLNLIKWPVLSNSGQYLVLKDHGGRIIHFMEYSPGMYSDALKRDGGWSLDLICRSYPCAQESWKPSRDLPGGTPGFLVVDECYSLTDSLVKPIRCGYIDSLHGLLYLSNYLRPDTRNEDLVFFSSETQLIGWEFVDDRTNCILFTLSEILSSDKLVKLDVFGDAESCGGQQIASNSVRWMYPMQPDLSDILISEILFNPGSEGIEFIELYNASEKTIDAGKLIIATIDDDNTVKDFSRGGSRSILLFPEEYLVVSNDKNWMKRLYPDMPLENHVVRKDLPAFINSGGKIRILNSDQIVLDEIRYDPNWHNQRIKDHHGISLERLSFSVSGLDSNNWFSSSLLSGFATPGYKNSQSISDTLHEANSIWLQNSVFGPDLNATQSLAIIHFRMHQIGYFGQIEVRNQAGLLIKKIQNWNLLPLQGQFIWDGLDCDGSSVDSGIYILLFSYRHPDGSRGRWKKAVAIRNY
ncbi:MAG: lamin tail domain-containing protein [Bacteroidales bacterium]|nr:lamin tail domain-containing protein [Bacteroidales bacterium]